MRQLSQVSVFPLLNTERCNGAFASHVGAGFTVLLPDISLLSRELGSFVRCYLSATF